MRRSSFLIVLLVLILCLTLGDLLLAWHPFSSADADTVRITPRFGLLQFAPTRNPDESTPLPPSETPRPTRTATKTRTPTLTLTPLNSPTLDLNATPSPTSTPSPLPPTPTPNGPTPANELTATSIPAQATVDAMATRSYSNYETTPGPSPTPRLADRTVNILLLGSDQRLGDPHWNTDVIMIVSLDFENNRIGVLSVPRDLIVPIPGHDANRINEADFWGEADHFPGGGPGMVAFILRDQFNIRIDQYARVGFQGFDQVVDTLGGIDVKVPCAIQDTIDQVHFDIPQGLVHMDGITAQRYVRSRNTTNDLSRNARQQRVIYAIAQRLLQIDALSKAPVLWGELHDVVETDASLFDMISLGQSLAAMDLKNHPERIHARVLEPPTVYDWITPEGAYVFLPNYGLIEDALNNFDAAPEIGTTTQTECQYFDTPTPTAHP